MTSVADLRVALQSATDGRRRILLDLRSVSFADSTLAHAFEELSSDGAFVEIVGTSPAAARLLELCGIEPPDSPRR